MNPMTKDLFADADSLLTVLCVGTQSFNSLSGFCLWTVSVKRIIHCNKETRSVKNRTQRDSGYGGRTIFLLGPHVCAWAPHVSTNAQKGKVVNNLLSAPWLLFTVFTSSK